MLGEVLWPARTFAELPLPMLTTTPAMSAVDSCCQALEAEMYRLLVVLNCCVAPAFSPLSTETNGARMLQSSWQQQTQACRTCLCLQAALSPHSSVCERCRGV